MPVAADNLTVSLTIDETSNAGKLKKMLDKLFGSEGEETVKSLEDALGELDGIDDATKQMIYEIRSEMDFLLPTRRYKPEEEGFKEESLRVIDLVKNDMDDIVDSLKQMSDESKRKILSEHGVEGEEDVGKYIRADIENLLKAVESDIRMGAVSDSTRRIVTDLENILGDQKQTIGKKLTALREAYDHLSERQALFNKIMTKAGLFIKTQDTSNKLNDLDDVANNIQKRMEDVDKEGDYSDLSRRIKEWIETEEEAKDLKKIFETEDWVSPDVVEKINDAIAEKFDLRTESGLRGLKSQIKEGSRRIDNILESNLEKWEQFKDFFTPELWKRLEKFLEKNKGKDIGTELKSIYKNTRHNKQQLKDALERHDAVLAIAEMLPEHIRLEMEKEYENLLMLPMNFYKLAQQMGIDLGFKTEEEREKFRTELAEKREKEFVKKEIREKLVKKIMEEQEMNAKDVAEIIWRNFEQMLKKANISKEDIPDVF